MNFCRNSRVVALVSLPSGPNSLSAPPIQTPAGGARVVLAPEPADGARRRADDRARLGVPRALAIGARADVDRVFQRGRDRPVVLGGDEQDGIGAFHLGAKLHPGSWRAGVVVLIVERKASDLDDTRLTRPRGDVEP